ncbi:MAG: hypothetical protein IAE84_04165 [Saprospiraceae bacterium]|nr:hypothetical protein [Saprospiraceae bacterium]
MIGTVWNSHFAASNALFGQFIQNYAQQSVVLRGIMRNWDEARIDAFMRLDVNDVRDFYFADLANRANAWGKLFDNGAEIIENALVTRYITETNRNAQVVGYVSGTALGRKTFKAINRLTLLAPPSTKPVVFVENMQDLLLSGKLSAEIDNGVVVIKARPDNGAWDEVARLSPDMSDATPVSNFQPADIRQTIYDPATGYSMALVCSGPRCSWVEGACFTAGTPVHTPAGLVPIEKISIGDTVLAYNESSKTPTLASVTNVFHKTWRGLLRIIAGRDTLLATPNHPFYLPGSGRYLPADSLRRGMQLLALSGTLLTVQSVAALDTTVSVYNFEVAEHHNYYVGEEGVLVHNDCVFVKLGLRNLPQQTPAHPIFDVFTNVFGTTPQATLNRMQFLEDYGRLSGQARADFESFFRADDLLGANPGITHEALLAARENRARAWGVLYSFGSALKVDVPTLTRLSDDFSNLNGLEAFLKTKQNKVGEWLEFDAFFISRNDEYWSQFNSPPNVLIQTRTQALKALQRYPDEYVEALEIFGLSMADLYTRHGVDYGDEFFQIIADFKASNSFGLTDSEIYAIFGYTTNFFYRNLNAWLRESINVSQTSQIKNLINNGLSKLPTWSDASQVYRGIRIRNGLDEINEILAKYPIGSEVTERSFTSLSASNSTPFLNHQDTKIKMVVTLKPNSLVKDIADLSDGVFYRNFPRPELIFPSNTALYVDNIVESDGIYTIFLTER